jgi:hypothetical protein
LVEDHGSQVGHIAVRLQSSTFTCEAYATNAHEMQDHTMPVPLRVTTFTGSLEHVRETRYAVGNASFASCPNIHLEHQKETPSTNWTFPRRVPCIRTSPAATVAGDSKTVKAPRSNKTCNLRQQGINPGYKRAKLPHSAFNFRSTGRGPLRVVDDNIADHLAKPHSILEFPVLTALPEARSIILSKTLVDVMRRYHKRNDDMVESALTPNAHFLTQFHTCSGTNNSLWTCSSQLYGDEQ